MASFTQQALRILEEERRVAQVEEQKRIAAAEAEAAAKEQAERAVRVQLQAERELARIVAERALAEEQALAVQAAEAAALQAELARLRARSEIEVLRDEMMQMRAEMAALKACHLARLPQQDIHLRSDGELDAAIVKTVVTERKFLVTCPSLERQLSHESGWSINFIDKEKNIFFGFGSRPQSNVIIMNTFKRSAGGWGQEDRLPLSRFDCSPGNQVLLTLTRKGFLISAKGSNPHFYPHRFAEVNIQEIVHDWGFGHDQNLICIEL